MDERVERALDQRPVFRASVSSVLAQVVGPAAIWPPVPEWTDLVAEIRPSVPEWTDPPAGTLFPEESIEDAVELLWPFGLWRVACAFDHGEPRALDQRVCACGVGDGKERIVSSPYQLDGNLELVQSLGQVVVAAHDGARRQQRADRGEVRAGVAVGREHLAKVSKVCVVHGRF